MKRIILSLLCIAALCACTNDDQYELSDFVGSDTLTIHYNQQSATFGTLPYFVTATAAGAHVTVTSFTGKNLVIRLSGSSEDGSLIVFSNRKYAIDLNGLTLTNPKGPAINNQCGKSLIITTVGVNTLTDNAPYINTTINTNGDTIQQKGTLFSEGQSYFRGNGTLNINGNARNGIASDDYITFESGIININMAATATNGVKANDGVFIQGGSLNIDVTADGARGIRNEARMVITGGTTNITTSGDCKIETLDGIADTTSCAGIKCDSLFTMSAGTLTITSTGDGGKGINAAEDFLFSGGTLDVQATGTESEGKPKAVKSDTGIILSGGSFHAYSRKSKAVDNAGDELPTIVGTPNQTSLKLTKREVNVVF